MPISILEQYTTCKQLDPMHRAYHRVQQYDGVQYSTIDLSKLNFIFQIAYFISIINVTLLTCVHVYLSTLYSVEHRPSHRTSGNNSTQCTQYHCTLYIVLYESIYNIYYISIIIYEKSSKLQYTMYVVFFGSRTVHRTIMQLSWYYQLS